jgi:hypothetical protein
MENPVIARVLERMEWLPTDLQQLVLDFVQTLQTSAQQGLPGKEMLQFAGAIPADDIGHMRRVVTVACEQVPVNEW